MLLELRLCRICRQEKHIELFYLAKNGQGREYRRRVCSGCYHRNREVKRVPLPEMRPFVREIVHRCGSIRYAAEVLGTTPMVIRRWLGLSLRYEGPKRYRDKRMNRETAAHVLETLRQLRLDQVFYEHRGGFRPSWLSVDDAEAERGRKRRAAA